MMTVKFVGPCGLGPRTARVQRALLASGIESDRLEPPRGHFDRASRESSMIFRGDAKTPTIYKWSKPGRVGEPLESSCRRRRRRHRCLVWGTIRHPMIKIEAPSQLASSNSRLELEARAAPL